MDLYAQRARAHTRRQFLKDSQAGLGAIALSGLLGRAGKAARTDSSANPMTPRPPHFPARAKHVIYLHMSGGPPQQDLFDYKPELVKHHLQPCPDFLLKDQKFAFIGKEAFTKAGQVRYEKTKKETFVYLNTDNDKAAEAVIKLKGAIDLSKGWFVL